MLFKVPVFAAADVNPLGPDHAYDIPPDAVNEVVSPKHNVLFPVILQIGAFTVSVLEQELVHPLAPVTVTVYVAAVRLLTAAVLSPPGNQEYV